MSTQVEEGVHTDDAAITSTGNESVGDAVTDAVWLRVPLEVELVLVRGFMLKDDDGAGS